MINVIGDSHTRRLMAAHADWTGEPLPPMRLHPIGSGMNLYAPFHVRDERGIGFTVPELAATFKRTFERDRLFYEPGVVWGFSMGFHSTPFVRADVWRKFAPIDAVGGPFRQRMSAGVFRRLVELELQAILAFFESVRAENIPFFVVSAPPPPSHHRRFLHKRMRSVQIAANAAYRAAVRDIFDEHGIAYLLPPSDTADENGLLLTKYNMPGNRDQHHANRLYGALVLPTISAMADKLLSEKQERSA